MPIWTDQYLLQLYSDAEIAISQEVQCIFDRFSLSVTNGVPSYNLDDNIIGIDRITWKGKPVDPVDQRELNNAVGFNSRYIASSLGEPRWYIRLGHGFNAIRFFPTPNVTILADPSDEVWGAAIPEKVILSVKRSANSTADYRLPDYILRRTAKNYVLKEAYAKEGKGQDLNAAEFYEKRYDFVVNRFKVIFAKIPRSVLQILDSGINVHPKIPRPTLPQNYGTRVD